MPPPSDPVLCCNLPGCVPPIFVQLQVTRNDGWSPLSSCLVVRIQVSDTLSPTVVFEAVDVPYPGPFHFFSHCSLLCLSVTYHCSFFPQSKGLAVKQLEEDRVDLEQLRTRVGEDGRQIKQLEGLLENKDTEISRLTQVHILMAL